MSQLAVGLGWWFRRGDRQVRMRLARAQLPSFPEPTPNAGAAPEALPPAPGDRFQPMNGHS